MKQNLSDAIADYHSFRRSLDIKKATTASDRTVLGRFLAENGNIWVHQINDTHVVRHFEVSARTRQPSSLAIDHRVLSGFFAWARKTKRMATDNDPMFGRRQPRGSERDRVRIHVSQFDKLLAIAGRHEPRNRMAVALGLYTLARDSELRDLRLRDVDLNAGYIHMRIFKTRQEDHMPISEELDGELRRWLTYYTTEVGELEPHYYLLPARRVVPIKGDDGRVMRMEYESFFPERPMQAMPRWIHPVFEEMGIDDKGEGAHTLRRSGARALFDSLVAGGYDHALRTVQNMLHHKTMARTEIYIGMSEDRRTRDQIIRGKKMYALPLDNVVSLAN